MSLEVVFLSSAEQDLKDLRVYIVCDSRRDLKRFLIRRLLISK